MFCLGASESTRIDRSAVTPSDPRSWVGGEPRRYVGVSRGVSKDELSMVPRLREGIDLTKTGLSVEEGFVASRIDGQSTIGDITAMVGKPREHTLQVLRRLVSAGVIRFGGGTDPAKAPTPAEVAGGAEYGRFIFPPALMKADCDLSEEERKRIIYFAENLDTWTYYELLQLDWKSDARAVKRAYFARSKEWHPDRYLRPNLGPFRAMLLRIFREIQNAYQVLSNPKARAKYDRENAPKSAGEEEIAERLAIQRRKERDARREVEALERRRKKNPIRKRMQKARGYFREAVVAREEGQLLEALRLAQTAQTFDNQPEYSALVEELKAEAGELRVAPYLKRGQAQESLTNWDEAIRYFKEAVDIAPRNGAARVRLAYNLLMGRRPPSQAEEHAHRGVQLRPDDPEAHFVLGMWYERKAMEKSAARSYSRAVELKSNYAEAKKRLRALKWGF